VDAEQFDCWTKVFAAGRSRREALRVLAAAALGSGAAGRQVMSTEAACNGFLCEGGGGGGATCCYPGQFCCPLASGNETCCWPGQVCDPSWTCRASCPAGRAKCGNFCCQPGEACHPIKKQCFGRNPQERTPTSSGIGGSGGGGSPGPTQFCPTGLTDCGGQCVNRRTDAKNCGLCGKACDPLHETCVNGQCCPVLRSCDTTCCPECFTCDRLLKVCRPCDQKCEVCGDPFKQCLLKAIENSVGIGVPCSPYCDTCFKGVCRANDWINEHLAEDEGLEIPPLPVCVS
jgi:hypothetical protein